MTARPLPFIAFTAAYNRAGALPRVRESVRSQTFRDLDLIVDDGSTDETEQLVERRRDAGQLPTMILAGHVVRRKKGVP